MVTYWGEHKKYRNMDSIDVPDFEAPTEYRKFNSGNAECSCICNVRHLPRNAILIRPKQKNVSTDAMYKLLTREWKRGRFNYMSMGTCQSQIRSSEIGDLLKEVKKHFTISCVDNVDNRILNPGDILLSRIGSKRSIGKPHLIKSRIWGD